MWTILYRRDRIIFSLRIVAGAEEAAVLEVKQCFGFSLLSAEGNPQFLFQHVNVELPRGPGALCEVPLRQSWVTGAQKLFGMDFVPLHVLLETAKWVRMCFLPSATPCGE